MRLGASCSPRHVGFLRFTCDSKVPTFLLYSTVSVQEEVIETIGGPLTLEWVLPPWLTDNSSDTCLSARTLSTARIRRIMLYMHGGAFVLCTPGSLRGCTAPIAHALDAALCVPEYRRPPDHSIESALEDGLSAYRHLLAKFPEAEIWIGGESAGGSLAASMLLALRGSQLPLPAKALLMSPWTDISGDGDECGLSHCPPLDVHGRDYLVRDLVAFIAKQARGELNPRAAPASPIYAEGSLVELPPMLVLYGLDEVLCGQIERFIEVWKTKGARIQRLGVAGGVHAPVLFHWCHSPSKEALKELARFFGTDPLALQTPASAQDSSPIRSSEVPLLSPPSRGPSLEPLPAPPPCRPCSAGASAAGSPAPAAEA